MMKFKPYQYYYLIALAFNLFPSYSISVFVSSIFVQPRFFGTPFLFLNVGKIKIDLGVVIIFLLAVISLTTPVIGLLFDRQASLLDAALILNWVYLLFFYIATQKNIALFNSFLKYFLWMNLIYIVFQLIVYYSGFPDLTMLHSNVPFHVESGYMIEPSYFDWLPRYTGLFIESGPLTLFLCFTFLYLIQNKDIFSKKLIWIVLICILFTQSKFEILFFPMLLLEAVFLWKYHVFYEKLISPILFLASISLLSLSVWLLFSATSLNEYLIANLGAYEQRLNAIQDSINNLSDIKIFGNIYQGSNYDASNGILDLQKWDIFSILFFGYGVGIAAVMLMLIFAIPIMTRIKFKFTAVAMLILAFLSSGSLLVPQYSFFIIYCLLIHNRARMDVVGAK